jgi:uncharacterized protein YjbJ (UPF0337 family)
MKSSTKDQANGRIHQIKGKVKEIVGQATSDANLESKGKSERIAGKVQQKVGQIKKVFGK